MLAVCSVATSAAAQSIAKGKNELAGDVSFSTTKPTGEANEDADRFTSADLGVAYSRYVTDRLAVGPLFGISKAKGSEATGYLGGLGRYHFGDLSRRAVPIVEMRVSRSLNDAFANYTDLQLLAGVMFPMGSTGGRFRVTPYYYKAFYNEAESGVSDFQSFGISWGVALLF